MAIGTIKLQGTPQQYSSPSVSPNAFGAGVAVALRGLGGDLQKVEDAEKLRQGNIERVAADTAWARTQGEWNREQLDVIQNAPETGAGMTNSRYDSLEAKRQEFLGTLSPAMQERMRATTQIAVENLTSNTYAAEFELNNNYETRAIADTINEAAGGLIAGTTTLEGAMSAAGTLITSSNLSDAAKAVALDAMEEDLLAASFHRELSQAQTSMGPTRDWRDGEVVAAGLSPSQVGLLNATASEESAGSYTVRWSGPGNTPQHFTDFSDHPRIFVDNGHGDVSSAAGRYQITASTWDSLPARFRQGGFTPENQDRAALYLAEQRYNQAIGPGERSFAQIMAGGSDADLLLMRDTLAPTWAAFEHMADDKFINIFRGSQGQAGSGTGSSEVPDVWTDPAYSGLSVERRMQMENDARVTSNNILNQQQQALESNAEQLRIAFAAGDPTARLMSEQAIQNGQVPVDEIAALIKLGDEDRVAERGGQDFYSAMVSGTSLANNADNQANALDFFTRNGIVEGVQNLDPEAGQMLTQSFAQSGVMPTEVSDLLMSMYNSPNPQTMSYGMGLLAEMQAKGRNQFGAAMPEEIVEATTAWSLATKYSAAGDTAAVSSLFQTYRSPEQAELRERLTEEAETLLMDIPTEEILDGFRSFWDKNNLQIGADNRAGIISSEILAPRDPQSLAVFRTDANKLFTQYYPLFQDQDQTIEFVTEMMSNSWGADSTGGTNDLTYLPLNVAGYQTLGGTHDWAREDILQSQGWPSDKQFNTIADEQTERDIANGLPGSYTITEVMPNGTMQIVMDDSGTLPRRFRPTISQNLLDQNARRQELSNMEGRRERVNDGITQARQILYAATEARDAEGVAGAEETIRNLETTLTNMDASIDALDPQVYEGVDVTALREELADLQAPLDESSPTNNLLRGIGEGLGMNIWSELTNSKERRITEIQNNLRALGATE